MTVPHASYEFRFIPDYRLITLRDREIDAVPQADRAIDQAAQDIAASAEYEIFISCAQDLLPVTTRVEVWSQPPAPPGASWIGPIELTLLCPVGEIYLGSPTGPDRGPIDLPAGPGAYLLHVSHRGRDEATAAARDPLSRGLREGPPGGAGDLEQYLIQIWYGGELPDDEDDDDL
jgi:hypothetical protein